jgi:hypothetical protein
MDGYAKCLANSACKEAIGTPEEVIQIANDDLYMKQTAAVYNQAEWDAVNAAIEANKALLKVQGTWTWYLFLNSFYSTTL